jgi:hypothetical protein
MSHSAQVGFGFVAFLEHLSGVKGGCPLEEAYYLKLSLFQGVEYFC